MMVICSLMKLSKNMLVTVHTVHKQEICRKSIKARFFNVIIQDIAVHGTND